MAQWYKNLSVVDYTYEQKVLNGLTGAFDITSVDLNNDGAIDVVTANGSLWWYQNVITQLPSGLKETGIKDYQIYPNPISTEINIKGLEGDGYTIAIYNTLGQEMLKTSLTNGRAIVSSLESTIQCRQVQLSRSDHKEIYRREWILYSGFRYGSDQRTKSKAHVRSKTIAARH